MIPRIPVIVGIDRCTLEGDDKPQKIFLSAYETPCREIVEYAADVLKINEFIDNLVLIRQGAHVEDDAVVSGIWEGEQMLISRRP